jgi:hypothetical protein
MNRRRYAKKMDKKPSERNHGANQTITAAVMNDNRKRTKKKESDVKMIGHYSNKAQQKKRRDAP